ncbi:hypothetical protein VT84_00335 [Gemmata sp. SH-PL17]|uniref:DUF1559 family PulG-like putative transporter n=1 Tax=Gemmata sp. SH-PL17 TaxID=1630693 RepID=UPI00078C39B5|nr:DUF1559 domain-containing protein [Gemmata sp. SH-PL17]AMV22825.1 hypothetical protein VT84_00335 [Gemmata sp. SH-PL17]
MPRRYVVVIVALVLLGAGLFFPFVQKVREAAARMNCHSHFKGWALALHNYADGAPPRIREGKPMCNAFPAGTIPNPALPPEQRLSWWVVVLPYLEHDDVFKQFDLSRGPGDPKNEMPVSRRFRHLVCPTSGEYTRGNSEHWKSPTPLTHYVGVAGVGADAAILPPGHPKAGVFGYDRRTGISDDFLDGLSNALLLIETARDPGHWAFGGPATVRGLEPSTAPYIGPGQQFGGFHNGGPVLVGSRTHTCTVALADGSVRSLTNATAPEVLEALATVAGKEELPANW